MTESIPFHGADFHVAEKVGLMPLMRFAKLAKAGVDVETMEGLAAVYDLLEQCIHPDDWNRFCQHVTDLRLDNEELLELVPKVMSVLADRPTGRSSDSSVGPRTIEPSSPVVSSSPDTGPDRVIGMFNEQGRPDLALLVRKRQESLSA